MDVMAEFGLKMDEEAKDAITPEEHKAKENGSQKTVKEEKAKKEKAKKKKKYQRMSRRSRRR